MKNFREICQMLPALAKQAIVYLVLIFWLTYNRNFLILFLVKRVTLEA